LDGEDTLGILDVVFARIGEVFEVLAGCCVGVGRTLACVDVDRAR